MATVILIRHGRSTANTTGILAGRTGGVALDRHGLQQARSAGERLQTVSLSAIISSPLKRCRQTAQAIAREQSNTPGVTTDRGINECDYGQWQGRYLSELSGDELWTTVQTQPSAAVFPGGESLASMQARAVSAIRRQDAAIEAEHGASAVWAAVSHGDLIKSIVADALGMHLDLFQRLHIDPASATVISYTNTRPYVTALNADAADLTGLSGASEKAQVGGGAGPDEHSAHDS